MTKWKQGLHCYDSYDKHLKYSDIDFYLSCATGKLSQCEQAKLVPLIDLQLKNEVRQAKSLMYLRFMNKNKRLE